MEAKPLQAEDVISVEMGDGDCMDRFWSNADVLQTVTRVWRAVEQDASSVAGVVFELQDGLVVP
jgi:hypothetical protein